MSIELYRLLSFFIVYHTHILRDSALVRVFSVFLSLPPLCVASCPVLLVSSLSVLCSLILSSDWNEVGREVPQEFVRSLFVFSAFNLIFSSSSLPAVLPCSLSAIQSTLLSSMAKQRQQNQLGVEGGPAVPLAPDPLLSSCVCVVCPFLTEFPLAIT